MLIKHLTAGPQNRCLHCPLFCSISSYRPTLLKFPYSISEIMKLSCYLCGGFCPLFLPGHREILNLTNNGGKKYGHSCFEFIVGKFKNSVSGIAPYS